MSEREFRVYGKAAPQGSKRHVGGGRMIESSKEIQPWREAIKWAYLRLYEGEPPMQGPLEMTCAFYLERPKSLPKKVVFHIKKPDLDKLVRGLGDALTACGAWVDDSQVTLMTPSKDYADAEHMPGVFVTIKERTQ